MPDEYTLLRKGLPNIQEMVYLFLTVGKFLVNEITMSYRVNGVHKNKKNSSSNSCFFMEKKQT
jgi:hypothetical protein